MYHLKAEGKRYPQLLLAERLDLAFVSYGENWHIAFNDPPTADFNDPATVKQECSMKDCRRQQVREVRFRHGLGAGACSHDHLSRAFSSESLDLLRSRNARIRRCE